MSHADTPITSYPRMTALASKMAEANRILIEGIDEHIHRQGRKVAAVGILYSGGNDSTVLAHMFRDIADVAVHANTGIGIEQTRDFVRSTCKEWGLRLIEKHPPVPYDELVMDQGFPGPAQHFKMYQRLKERCLRQARNELVSNPRKERVVFLGGRRRDESARRGRELVTTSDRDGSMVFISPLINWTSQDMNTYRAMFDVPRNEVSDCLHMSGECLCGAFAAKGELEEIADWYPETAERIRELERRVKAAGKVPEQRCQWGWGAYRDEHAKKAARSGPLCTSCEFRMEAS